MSREKETNELEMERLARYAAATGQKVIDSQADLNPKDRAMPEMLAWCKEQGHIVVLNSGMILTSIPTSRIVQNCKIVMVNKGLRPGAVRAATSSLIRLVVANVAEESEEAVGEEQVSIQQQRLRMLVKEAVEADASDIHIEVRKAMAKIRFRKHGELYLHAEWLPKLGREIASVAFNKETDNAVSHFNPMVPQDASMPLVIDNHEVRLRLASMPAHGGFDMVLRVLATHSERVKTLKELGYREEQIKLIRKAAALPHGAVIMSGPTGSGKTTTLAACMSMVNLQRKVYTIEDPVEKIVETVTQVPVNTEHTDRSFASMGRASLRMDPDVIVLGEMRDEDTAAVMVRASITGHLVFSTLHTNSAPAIVTRLVDLGVSQNMLADPNLLACLIFQRLIPRLCDVCAVPVSESADHREGFARWQHVFGEQFANLRARGKHCKACNGLGISGRTVIAEIIWVDEGGREYVKNVDILGWEKYLKANGWKSYRDQAIRLATEGLVDPYDVEKMTGEISTTYSGERFNYDVVL